MESLKKPKGRHVFIDVIGFNPPNTEDAADFIFTLMKMAIRKNSKMEIMADTMVVLKEPKTEDGFTSVLLLDESHFTSHAYTKRGLLALDIFTCGGTDPDKIATWFMTKLQQKYPSVQIANYEINSRFRQVVV
jgi:S-adenosylmethionine/arginine decarboxylase-like enzyme